MRPGCHILLNEFNKNRNLMCTKKGKGILVFFSVGNKTVKASGQWELCSDSRETGWFFQLADEPGAATVIEVATTLTQRKHGAVCCCCVAVVMWECVCVCTCVCVFVIKGVCDC